MQMRSFLDRVRHAVSFEVIGLAILTPLAAFVFDRPALDMGVISAISATVAMLWNFVFNTCFDRIMIRRTGSARKSLSIRVLHTLLFEGGLLVMLLPLTVWYLDISLWDAVVMDLAIELFYLVYTFFFNLAYDHVYPPPDIRPAGK